MGDARRREGELKRNDQSEDGDRDSGGDHDARQRRDALGTLRFTDGFPDDATVEKVFDNLDFQHAVQAFLTTMPVASRSQCQRGVRGFGPDNQTVIIFESLMDPRSLFLTANTESISTAKP